jgi:hypothetical protein
MNNTEQMRTLITALNESTNRKIDTNFAINLLHKISPTLHNADEEMNEAGLGATVAFIAVFVGGAEIANVGPLDMNGAQQMQREISQDIERSYENYHPKGFTDGSGTIYRFTDWDIKVETCHSSECSEIIADRMARIHARAND